jgi:hypothetical protein
MPAEHLSGMAGDQSAFLTCWKSVRMETTIEISQRRTARPIGRISIANVDATSNGFDFRRK